MIQDTHTETLKTFVFLLLSLLVSVLFDISKNFFFNHE